jgi:xanthine/CO dehydrogenase XdhC/CoxF family maturation factor
MNEMQAFVEAFDAAVARGERCALATVVSVEGSSYRRPGARMLVLESGATTGTVSAGCLESDVVERAKGVLKEGIAKLIRYDTSSASDEEAWGLGMGCNGIVRVLLEPLAQGSAYVEALREACEVDALPVSVATVYESSDPQIQVGGRVFVSYVGEVTFEHLRRDVAEKIANERKLGEVQGVFVEALLPPAHLIVFGGGADVVPVVELARTMGWHTEVVDPQARGISRSRFAKADRVILARPEDLGDDVRILPRTMTLLMSHHYAIDRSVLGFALASPANYIGVLGPRHRTERMLRDLGLTEEDLGRLHAPAGLDIGANGPVEIALSIVAEMRAVMNGRGGGMLREHPGPIHRGLHREASSAETHHHW